MPNEEIITAYEDDTFETEVTEQEIIEALEESGLAELLKDRSFPTNYNENQE